MLHLRLLERLLHVVDAPARDARLVELLDPVVAGVCASRFSISALSQSRCTERSLLVFERSSVIHSGAPIASAKRSQILPPNTAMLMWPSLVLYTPVGMLVGWKLPACPGISPSIVQREIWKSIM